MTADRTPITSRADLNAELAALFRRADSNGVDIKGGWDCPGGSDHPDWDVVVTEVQRTEVPE